MKITVPTTSTTLYDILSPAQRDLLRLARNHQVYMNLQLVNKGVVAIYLENRAPAVVGDGAPILAGKTYTFTLESLKSIHLISDTSPNADVILTSLNP